ncbi:pseudouridine synthase [Lampropedia cohaerens]|nr:pseudouridine synthase [Lampropedia cohaerens]
MEQQPSRRPAKGIGRKPRDPQDGARPGASAARRGPAALRKQAAPKPRPAAGPARLRRQSAQAVPAAEAPADQQELAQQPVDLDDLVTGRLDAIEEAGEAQAYKRVLQPDAEQPKLHKVLAQAGVGSRLEMEALIQQGRVTVNDQPAHVGQRVQYGDQIRVNGKPVRVQIAPPRPRVLAYHKLAGEMVTRDDPLNRPTVFRKLPPLYQGKWQAVGRLDLNTEGLLLLTNSGDLANRLMHPRYGLEREYAVRVLGALTEQERAQLLEGVQLDDGEAAFSSVELVGGEGVNQWYKVTISEGRNREVRRMMEAVGHAVSRLIRIRYGSVVLMRGLRRGMWQELSERDVDRLMQEAGLPQPGAALGGAGSGRRPAAGQRRVSRANPDRGGRGGVRGRASAGIAPEAAPRRAAPVAAKQASGYIGQEGVRRRAPGGARKGNAPRAGGRNPRRGQ